MAFAVDNKKIAKNTIALYIRMAVTMVISFFTARITLEQLGVEDYGLNNLVGSIVSMFSFINGSMGTAVQRFYSIEIGKGNENRLKRIFGTGLYLHIIVAMITLVIAEIFAVFFLHKMNIPEERQFAAQVVFQISVLSLSLNIINVPYAALLRAREMFSKTAMVEIIQSFLRLGVLYLLVIIGHDKLIIFSLLGFCITLYNIGAYFYMARSFNETHCKPIRDKEIIRKIVSFISLLIITVLCQLACTQGMIMLINMFFGLAINAAYAIAIQVSNIVSTFAMSFKQSMVPQMMAAYGANDLTAMRKIVNIGTKVSFILMLIISIPVIFESEYIMSLWLGTPPVHSVNLVVLTLIYVNISSFTYFIYQGVHAAGNIKKQQIWMSSMYIVNIVLIFIVFECGADFKSAIYVNMSVSVLQCLVNLIYARNNYGYNILHFAKDTLFPCCLLLLILCSSLFIVVVYMEKSIYRLATTLLLSGLEICLLGYFVLFNKQEKISVNMYVKNKFRR